MDFVSSFCLNNIPITELFLISDIIMNRTLTIFTPAYNRAHTIGRTYESLCRQTCKDFEWLIIDDGSSDNTHELVEGWIRDNCMALIIRPIRIFIQN